MAQLQGVALDARQARPVFQPPEEVVGTIRQPHAARSGVIALALRTKLELYQAWMPFVRGGGIFVALRKLVETILAGAGSSSRPTHTL